LTDEPNPGILARQIGESPEWLLRTMELLDIIKVEDIKLSDSWKDAF
jgi:hypothetical protein